MVNAGTVAQRRRPHRCLSASHVPLGQKNSRGLSSFVDLPNSNINEDGIELAVDSIGVKSHVIRVQKRLKTR